MNTMTKNDLIKINIDEYITHEEKEFFWENTKTLALTMFDRQQEFNIEQKNALKERRTKIYIGIIAENIFIKYFLKKYPEFKNKLIIEGMNKKGVDEFDIILFDKKIDIKSSKEKYDIKNLEDSIINKRNYTLPEDQQGNKDFILQIFFEKKGKEVYITGFIDIKELVQEKNKKNLGLNNNNNQITYMKEIKYGISLNDFILEFNPSIKKKRDIIENTPY